MFVLVMFRCVGALRRDKQEELVAQKFMELEKALMADPRLAILYS